MTVRRTHVQAALEQLRAAADASVTWPRTTWRRLAGPAPDKVDLVRGRFDGTVLGRNAETLLEWQVLLPALVSGGCVDGEPLELTVESLFPLQVNHDGRLVLDAREVAPGPALVTVIPALHIGDNGTVRVTVTTPDNQVGQWLHLGFSTPTMRERFEVLDLAWARIALAESMAQGTAAGAHVDRAVALLAIALDDLDTPALVRLGDEVAVALAPLADEVARLRIHLVGHSHIDMNWQWTWSDTAEVIYRDLASVVAIMDEYPEMTFTHSQPVTYDVVRTRDPALFARILGHIRSGRWEAATMQWVEADTNMASGEATVRQLLEAVRWSRATLGVQPIVHLAPDTFGHAGNLPQLTASAGTGVYYHHRCNPGGADPYPAYWWEGQDGTRLLAVSTSSYNGTLAPSALAVSALQARAHGHNVALHFHGVGNHGGGPARQGLEMARRLQEQPGMPELRFSTLAGYRDDLLARDPDLPVHRGESRTLFEGCYTTHANVKAFNRHSENLLATAEALAVLAGRDERAALDTAWRLALFHQFHDILDGSAIHEAYEQSAEDADTVEMVAGRVVDSAMGALSAAATAGTVVVVNPTGHDRVDVVTLPLGAITAPSWLVDGDGERAAVQAGDRDLCFIARVPAFGTAVYHADSGEAPAAMEVRTVLSPVEASLVALRAETPVADDERPYLRVRTGRFDVHVRRNAGIITSLVDRVTGREFVGYGMRRGSDYNDSARPDLALNVLQVLDEHPHEMSSWHLDEVWRETSLLRGAETTVVECGPVRTVLRTRHHVRDSTINQRMTLYADLGRVDVELDVDWRELGSSDLGTPNLKVAVTARLDSPTAWYETPYGAACRPTDGQEVPALRWADVSSSEAGVALLNDSRHGHDALGSRLRLSLLRSGYEPDPVSDVGRHTVRYSIVPHARDPFTAGVPAMAVAFNQPLLCHVARAAAGGDAVPVLRPHVESLSVHVTALATAHDRSGDIIVRLAETAGRDDVAVLHGIPARAAVSETTVVEDRLADVEVNGDAVTLAFRPWQVRTLRIRPPLRAPT